MTRPDRDTYFLAGAEWASARAECLRRKVGALLVLEGKVRGHGYNGALPGLPSCLQGACPRGQLTYSQVPADSNYSNCIADHAERNCIRNTDPRHVAGATLYVSAKPCPACWTLIYSVGISRVVWAGSGGPEEQQVDQVGHPAESHHHYTGQDQV